MVFTNPAVHSGIRLHRRRGGHAPLELAAAAALRLALDHVLAGRRAAGPVPHPLRRRKRPRPSSSRPGFPPPHVGPLGKDVTRRARKIPPRLERSPLRPVRAPRRRNKAGGSVMLMW